MSAMEWTMTIFDVLPERKRERTVVREEVAVEAAGFEAMTLGELLFVALVEAGE